MLNEINAEVNQTNAKLNSIGTQAVSNIAPSMQKVQQSMTEPFSVFSKNATSHLALVSQRIRTFGYLSSATVTAPMVMAGKSILSMASDYEFAIQKIVGLTGTAQNVADAWSVDIQNMAKTFGRGPQELAEGLYFIASSGIQGAQALDVLQKSAKAAATGLSTTQEVANYLTSVLNAYRGTGLTAAYATDVLVAAVREGKAEASGFASAMGSLTPIASQLGVSIDQVAGAMAAITLTGSTSAQAATYLRGVFNVLMKETKQGTVAMDEASAALGQMKTSYGDLRKILREQGVMALMEKLNELSAAYGETLVSKVFPNIRAMLGVLSLSGKNMEYNSSIMKEITESSGALGKAFMAVSDTIKLRYDKALVGIQTKMITLGKTVAESLIPIFESLVKAIEKITNWFESLSKAQQENIARWALYAAAAGPALLILSTLGYTLLGVMNAVNGAGRALIWFTQIISGTRAATIAAEAATVSWVSRITMLGKSLKTLALFFATNPFGLIIAGLTTGIVLMTKKIREMKAEVESMKDALEFTTPEMELDTQIGDTVYKQIAGTGKYVKALNELGQDELYNLQQMIDERISLEEAKYNKLLQVQQKGLKNDEFLLKQKQIIWEKEELIWNLTHRNNPHWEENRIAIIEAQKAITAANSEINNHTSMMAYDLKSAESNLKYYKDLRKEVESFATVLEKETEKREAQAAADQKIIDIRNDLKSGEFTINRLFEWGDGKEADKIKEMYNLYDGIVKRIAEIPELSLKVPWVKDAVNQWNEFKEMVNDTGKMLTDFNADLAVIDMKKLLLGSSFDAESAKLDLYKKHLDDLLESVSKKKPEEITLIDQNAIKDTVRIMDELETSIQKRADDNLLRVLQMEADAFGGLSGKIEVVNQALQATHREIRAMYNQKSTDGIIDEEALQSAITRLRELKMELVSLQNAQEMQWLEDMDRAMHNLSSVTNLFNGKISSLTRQLQALSENGEGSTATFQVMANQLKALTIAGEVAETLSSAFNDLFRSIIEGGENMAEVLGNVLKAVLADLAAALVKMLIMRAIMATISGGALKGVEFMDYGIPAGPTSMAPGFAKGGVVPSGYSNDTYPALLSSGEAVLPKALTQALMQPATGGDGEVYFRIKDDYLEGMRKRTTMKKSLY